MTRSHNSQRGCSSSARQPRASAKIYSSRFFIDDDDLVLARENVWNASCDHHQDEHAEELFEDEISALGLDYLTISLGSQSDPDDDDEWSDVVSEWSVVSAAESAWTTASCMESDPPTTSWTLTDDAELARAIQLMEWGLLNPNTQPKKSHVLRPREPPAVQAPDAWRQACGLCVVCMESVALIAWEPCGHLALCGACHSQLTGEARMHCVICRCAGSPTPLLQPLLVPIQGADHGGSIYGELGLCLAASDGRLEAVAGGTIFTYRKCVEELEKTRLNKREWRKTKRVLTRMKKQAHPELAVSVGGPRRVQGLRFWQQQSPCRDQGLHVASASPADLVAEVSRNGQRRLATPRMPCLASMAIRRLAAHRASHSDETRAMRRHARQEEVEMHKWLAAVAVQADERVRTVGGPCRSCGVRDASMLPLKCGHVTLCRECWEHDGAVGLRGCGECGGECRLAMQLFKPMPGVCSVVGS